MKFAIYKVKCQLFSLWYTDGKKNNFSSRFVAVYCTLKLNK